MAESNAQFGQKLPSLIKYLSGILEAYPDGSQIIKELLQNSEDAGAKSMTILYDANNYGIHLDKLVHPDLVSCQGPSLCVFNDAKFGEKDWIGIQNLNDSPKQEDVEKIGKFGLGFNSVYHLTDTPWMISGTRIGIFEPTKKVFTGSGFDWDLTDPQKREEITTFAHQFEPLLETIKNLHSGEISILDNLNYEHTLFRFPLRKKESLLSSTTYEDSDVRELLNSFQKEANEVLLFLTHVERVIAMNWEENQSIKTAYEVEIVDQGSHLDTRRFLLQDIKRVNRSRQNKEKVNEVKRVMQFTIKQSSAEESCHEEWVVVHYIPNEQTAKRSWTLASHKKVQGLPWVSVGAKVANPGTLKGRTFCFLPLPLNPENMTGLPVHLNAYFGLESNRRNLKWTSSDQSKSEAAQWNEELRNVVLPRAYVQLIKYYQQNLPDDVYQLWPDSTKVHKRWKPLLKPFFQLLFQGNVIKISSPGGKWVGLGDLVYFDNLDLKVDNKNLVNGIRWWLDLVKAPYAKVPKHVMSALIDKAYSGIPNVAYINPCFVREVITKFSLDWNTIDINDRMNLLEYQVIYSENTQRAAEFLENLPVIPLADGSFGVLSKCHDVKFLLAKKEIRDLLLPMKNRIVLVDRLNGKVLKFLKSLSKSAKYNLELVDKSSFSTLLKECLPHEWSSQQCIKHNLNEDSFPNRKWLSDLWTFLKENDYYKTDLSDFVGFTILVLKDDNDLSTMLALPKQNESILLVATSFSPRIETLLSNAGVILVTASLLKQHEALRQHIHQGDANSFIKLLNILDVKKLTATLNSDEDTLHELQSFIVKNLDRLPPNSKSVLQKLPLFQMFKWPDSMSSAVNGTKVSIEFCIQCGHNYLGLQNIVDVPTALKTDKILLNCQDKKNGRLAQWFSIDFISINELARSVIENNDQYTREEFSNLMPWVMKRMNIQTFKSKLMGIAFVRSDNCVLHLPKDLFDPTVRELRDLFEEESNRFPVGEFADEEVVEVLRMLGLRTTIASVTCKELMETAKFIRSNNSTLPFKISMFLQILHQNWEKLTKKDFDKIKKIELFKAKECPPNDYPSNLPWFGADKRNKLYQATKLVLGASADYVGSFMPVLENDLPLELSQKLGILQLSDLLVSDFVQQLKAIADAHSQSKLQVQELSFIEAIIYTKLYQQLWSKEPAEVNQCLEDLGFRNWIWIQDKFVSAKEVIANWKSFPNGLEPYVYRLPSRLKEQRKILNFLYAMGVLQCDGLDVAKRVYQTIQAKYSSVCANTGDDENRDLNYVIQILNLIKDNIDDDDDVAVPISTGGKGLRFSSAKQCYYQDGGSYNLQLDHLEDKVFVHERVPNETAVKLGAKSLINVLLGAEDFEQEESIVGSLKDILRNYPVGSTLFCELLQNADDARAKEMGVMLDMRDGKEWHRAVLTHEMRIFQGPALWVYNDAVFTETDFTNVRKLRGATKKEDSDKIGSFGIGLNCIYHVTDVPSFVSDNFWVIFDPQRFCGLGARGKKINLKAAMLIPDQFKPLDGVFGCDLTPKVGSGDVHYSHTLFRLPLRNSHTVDKSEFGDKKVYDFPSTCQLLKLFADTCNCVLLFMQHVNKLDIKFLPNTDQDPKNAKDLLSVKCIKSLIGGNIAEIKNFIEASKEEMVKSNFTPLSQTIKLLIQITATGDAENMNIANRNETSVLWLVHWSLSDETAVKMAKSKRGRQDGLMPSVAIAVQIDELKNGKYKVKFIEGSAYCYLPLPIKTGLPFHIHAAFALASNRREIWKKSPGDMDERKAGWNAALMTENLIACLMQLLDKLKELDQNNQLDEYQYSSLWPDLNNGEFDSFGKAFYLRLCRESKLRLWKATGDEETKWVTFSKARFLSLSSAWSSEFKAAAEEIVKQFVRSKQKLFRLVTLTAKCEQFLKTLVPASVEEQTLMDEQFFTTYFFPQLAAYNPELSNYILVEILLSNNFLRNLKLQNLVVTNKCIPVAPSGNTRVCPSDLVLSLGDIAKLYTEDEGKFTHGIFNKREVQEVLVRLGMAAKPNHEILLDRAKSVETLVKSGKMNEARKRSTVILQFLSSGEVTDISYSKYLEVPFLFSLAKPFDWPDILPWFQSSDDETVYRPRKLTSKRFRYCVGSVSPIWHAEGLDEFAERRVMDRLKFGGRFSVQEVVKQLKEIGKLSSEQSKEHSKMVTDIVLACFDELKYKLTLPQSSKQQQQKQNTSKEQQWRQEIIAALKELETCKVLTFVDVGTVSFKHVSIHGTTHGSYLFTTKDTCYGQYSELLKFIGVKSNFSADDYINALKRMKEDYSNEPLPEHLLEVVNQICIQLSKNLKATSPELIEKYKSKVFLPDKKGTLLPSTSLFFCELDEAEIPARLKEEKISFCNDKFITRDVAENLGVRVHRESFVKAFYHPFGKSFGQREDLTLRIRNILKQYSNKDNLLREMIQNADDSGSTEIKFILDQRKLKNDKLLSVDWKDLQGTALVVCNNRPFTEDDYIGIENLGLGSKGEDCQSTGRFGIGFNTVYHITDAPMFLSNGDSLCILDPHMKYSPTANTDRPGGIFTADDQFKKLYPDVVDGFRPIKDIIWENSTIFRLPLRTSKMAEASKIGEEVTTAEIDDVLCNFAENAEEYLLFLKNIERISVINIDESGTIVYNMTFSAQVTDDESRINKNKFVEVVTNHTSMSTPITQFYEMKIHGSLKNSSSVWLISQRLGVLNECDAEKFSKLKLIPHVSVAVPLDCNYKQRFKMYVTQPLAGETSLPMHINGAFMPDEGRRQLLISGDSLEKDWNKYLLVSELAPLYVETLGKLKGKTTAKWTEIANETSVQNDVLKEYRKQLTMTDSPPGFVELTLMEEVYRLIHHEKRSLFFGLIQYELKTDLLWLTTTNGYMDELDQSRLTKSAVSHIRDLLTKVHFPNFHISFNQILKKIDEILHVSIPRCTPLDVCQFLKTLSDTLIVKEENLCTLPADLKTTIINENEIKNCLEYIISDTNADLENIPLLLTADGQLRRFKEDRPHYRSKYLQVLPTQSHLFTHEVMSLIKLPERFCKKFNIQALASHLPDEMPRLKSNKLIEDESRTWNLKLQRVLEFISKKFLSSKETENLTSLNNWALFPAICQQKKYLVPYGMISTVVHSSDSLSEIVNDSLYGILERLGCLFTDLPIDWHFNNFLRPMCASYDKPEKIIEILDGIFKRKMDGSNLEVLTPDDKEHLLKFIVDNQTFILRTKDRTKYVEIIKSFPLFQTLEGRFVSLEAGTDCEYIACNEETEGADLDKLKQLKSVILLKPTSLYNKQLFAYLGIKNLTVVEMYCKFIIPCMQEISGAARVKHFAWIMKRHKSSFSMLSSLSMLSVTDKNELLKLLGAAKVVEVSSGVFKSVNEFYEDDVDLFKAMLPVENFLPTHFWNLIRSLYGNDEFLIRQKEWKKFFHKLGLVKRANAETFLRLAKSLETWPNKEELEKNSKLLVSYLTLDEKLHLDSQFLQKIATVKFIYHHPISENLTFIYPQDDRFSSKLVCFSRSVCCDLENVCWSVASLLPSWSTVDSKLNPIYLKWKPEPDFEDFLLHMENVCNSLQKKKLMDHTVTEDNVNSVKQVKCQRNVLEHMLEYLRNHIANTQLHIERIQNIPCILVDDGKKMVCPKSVVREKFEECSPFLYILPDKFYPFIDLLERLGTKREVACHHYCSVLSELYSYCDNKQIKDPNLKTCLVTAYQGFLDQLCQLQEDDQNLTLCDLFLPDENWFMQRSTDLIVYDDGFATESIQKNKWNVQIIAQRNTPMAKYASALLNLPENIRPTPISQFLSEELSAESERCCADDCRNERNVSRLLQNSQFVRTVVKLITLREMHCDAPADQKKIMDKFNSVVVKCYDPLKMEVLNKETCELIERKDIATYLKRTNLLISHDANNELLKQHLIDNLVELITLICPLKSPHHLTAVLDKLDLENTAQSLAVIQERDIREPDKAFESCLPLLGSVLQQDLVCLLDNYTYNYYKVGEYIACSLECGGSDDKTYIFAQITKECESMSSDGTTSKQYFVDVGTAKPIKKSTWEIFKFITKEKLAYDSLVVFERGNENSGEEASPMYDSSQESERRKDPRFTKSLQEVMDEITEQLEDLWKLPKKERDSAIKRMYLTWHPDKSPPDKKEFCEEAFKYLKNEITRLESGLPRKKKGEKTSEKDSPKTSPEWEEFFRKWNWFAREERSSRDDYFRKARDRDEWDFPRSERSSWVPPSFETNNIPAAKLWLRQAQHDLKSAENDILIADYHLEWIFFKCHQIAEKAMKAIQYTTSVRCSISRSLKEIARAISMEIDGEDSERITLAIRKMDLKGVSETQTLYPSSGLIPFNAYQERNEDCKQVVNIASELCSIASAIVNNAKSRESI